MYNFSEGKTWKQIVRQSVPLTIAEIVHLLYNIIDRVYLGHMSSSDSMALSGVGLVFPIVSLIGAFTSLFGTGGAPLYAIACGAGEEKKARRIQSNVFVLLLLSSLALTTALFAFKRPILFLFGASERSYDYADLYFSIYVFGTPFTMLATGMNGFINAQGFPKVGMMTTIIGASLNIALDPLFIYTFDMGVQGAAIATVISQFFSCLWSMCFLFGKKVKHPIRKEEMPIELDLLKQIVSLGLVGFIMKGTNSLVQAVCNITLQKYGGDLYIGVMTVVNSVREVLLLPISGVTSGAQPVLGFNYGAKQYKRVCEGIRFITIVTVIYSLLLWLCILLKPLFFVRIFTSEEAIQSAGTEVLKIYFFGFFFMAFQSSGQTVFQALGDARHAILFSLLRKVVIVTPLTILLPLLGFGANGVFIAEPVSNIIGGLSCYLTMISTKYMPMKRGEL